MGVPTCQLRLARRSTRNDSLLAKLTDTDSVQTRQKACAVPRNFPVEQLEVGHSEETSPGISDFWRANESQHGSSTPVETALAVDTPVSAKRVIEAGNPALSKRVSANRAGEFTYLTRNFVIKDDAFSRALD